MENARLPEGKPSAAGHGHSNPFDLFPNTLPAVLPARWPNPNSRAGEALRALLQGPQNQADYRDSWRLAAYVKQLEYDGWGFTKRDIHRPGCRRAITEYALDRQDPATAAALQIRGVAGCS